MAKDKLEEALEKAFSDAGGAGDETTPQMETPQSDNGQEVEAVQAEATPDDTAGHGDGEQEQVEASQPAPQAKPSAQPSAQSKQPQAQSKRDEPKAPTTWSPITRQQWVTLPRVVRDQILKREGEISRALNESAQARQAHQQFQQTIAPFLPHLQASGVEPIGAVRNLLQTEYVLRSGSAVQKADTVAQIIAAYGIDVETLAARLEGKAPAQATQQPQQFRDPRLDQFLGHLQQTQQQRAQSTRSAAADQLEAFRSSGQAEFLDDVRDDMADLMAVARQRGKPLTLQQAYEKACLVNEDVRTVMEQRKADEAKRKQHQAAQQARHASGSVQTEPSPPSGSRKLTMEEALWAGLNGR